MLYILTRQQDGMTGRAMRFAVPAVTIMKDQMRGIVGTQPNAHQMFNTSAWSNYGLGIQHIHHRLDRKQIQLGRRNHRQVIGGQLLP